MRPLLKSNQVQKNLKQKLIYQSGKVVAQILGAVPPERQKLLPQNYDFNAHKFSNYFSSTHYGVMIPDFPEPHRYLSFASVIGDIGAPISHIPNKQTNLTPKNTATLVHGTALTSQEDAYHIYNVEKDLILNKDPFRVEFKNQSKIYENDGKYYLKTIREDLSVDLILEPTKAISWFTHSKIYQHFSVLMKYSGTFSHLGKTLSVSGLCTLEHWKSISQYSFIPDHYFIDQSFMPLDAFSYQVVNLNEEEQLVLGFICFAGQPIYTEVFYRNINGDSIQYDESFFEVKSVQKTPLITPDGYSMYMPQTFKWLAFQKGKKILDLNADVDTPYCFGLGAGYVGSYKWNGEFKGKTTQGRGYLEYIDRR